jgi:hypothetical protein
VSFIADAGTYVYTSDLKARALFRSTAYHSTVEVDGAEQNTTDEGTPFQLGDEARPRLLSFSTGGERDAAVAEHYGYARLGAGAVTHRRAATLDGARRCFVIEDTFEGEGGHEFRFVFHAAPGLEVETLGRAPSATDESAAVKNLGLADSDVHADSGVRARPAVEIRDGATGARLLVVSLDGFENVSVEPRWSSRGYGSKRESSAAVWTLRASAQLKARWLLVPVRAGEDSRARLELAENR